VSLDSYFLSTIVSAGGATPFAWQQGYGGFGVSKSNIAAMVRSIQNQERHHRKMTFEEEFIALLKSMVLNTVRDTFSVDCAAPPALWSFFYLYPALTRWANFSARLRRWLHHPWAFHAIVPNCSA
jgi:hypothetical protein